MLKIIGACLICTVLGACGLAFIAVLALMGSFIAGSPCHTSNVSETWSTDHAYKATIQEKDCGDGETAFYSVRVDAPDTPLLRHGGWFSVYDIEDDEDLPDGPPKIHWQTPRILAIDMAT